MLTLNRQQRPAAGAGSVIDQRETERFAVNAGATCTFAAPVVEDFGPVKVLNVSMGGVGLRLTRRVEPGALMAVTLANAAKGLTKTVLVRVVHVTPEPAGCLVGGTFLTQLTYQEMTALVL